MANAGFNPQASDDSFASEAQNAALLAQQAQDAAEAAQAAAEQALADTLAALAAQLLDEHADVTAAAPATNDGIQWNGSAWVSGPINLDSLGDVIAPAPSLNDVLQFDGSDWVPAPFSAGGALPLSGGTMTGPLILDAAPVLALEAATKAYVDASVGAASPYDIGVYFDGIPGADENILKFVSVRTFTLFSGLANSRAISDVAATGAYQISIQRNGVEVGTIDWSAAGTTGVFTLAADATFPIRTTL